MNILPIKDTVRRLLERKPHLRDDDFKLLANIYLKECKALGITPIYATGMDLLQMLADGKFTAPEAITRCRRKLQEHNPHLRGAKYKERKEKEYYMQKDLIDFDKPIKNTYDVS